MRKLTEGEYQSFLKDNNDLATACVALKRIMRAPDASGFTLSVIAEKALQAIQVTQDCPGLQQAQKTDSVDAASTIQPDDTGVMAEGVRCDTGVNDARPSASVPSVSSKAGITDAVEIMKRRYKPTEEGLAEARREIAAETTQTVTDAAELAEWRRGNCRGRLDQKKAAAVLHLLQTDMTQVQIAKVVGVSIKTVARYGKTTSDVISHEEK